MTDMAESGTAAPLPSTLLTFLIADVRGYTRFTVEHGDEAAARLALRFADLCDEVVSAHEGEVLELRGDEALCVFSSARNALRAAVALQGAFRESTELDASMPLQVGIGLDAGEAIPVKGGYRGGALNLAARLCSVAGPGDVFCSEAVIHMARKTDGLAFVDRGRVTLKGLAAPVWVIQIAPVGELPDELPPLQPLLVTHPTNLPDEPTPFIGRETEIKDISRLLRRPEVRMVTLTGPGGTGKTRLSLQVGSTLLHDFRDGVFFVSLASITDPILVPAAIAAVLGVTEAADRPILDTVVGRLEDKHLLLVLDNFEHVLDASTVVTSLLDACRELHVLVTSRIPLHLSREHEHSVPPLSVPDPNHLATVETLSQYESVALFIERARAAKDSFGVTNENAPAVAEICYRLDGLPLALELAAARIKLFPPQALLQRLSNRLKLLTGGARDRPTRQQTLRGAIDWSHSLLTNEEQTLFARLSVFAGGCTFEAAEAVCNPAGDLDLLEGMASLVDKSMLRQEGEDEPRFVMLETIREYAREKLEEQGEEKAIRDGHADHVLALAEEAKPFFDRRSDKEWLDRLAPERDNLRVAFRWLLEAGKNEEAARLTTALWGFWRSSSLGSFVEGRRQLEAVLARPDLSRHVRSRALLRLCYFANHQGATDRMREAADEALAIAHETGDLGMQFEALAYRWVTAINRGNQEETRENYDACIRLAPQTGDQDHMAQALRMQGFLALENGDFERAGQLFANEVALRRNPDVAGDLHGALVNVGAAALQRGDLDTAEAAYTENETIVGRQGLAEVALERGDYDNALRRYGEIVPAFFGERILPRLAECFDALAQIAAVKGRPALAALLVGVADALWDDLALSHQRRATEQERLDLARSAMGKEAWARECGRGRTLSLEEAVQLALQYSGDPQGQPSERFYQWSGSGKYDVTRSR